MNKPNCNNECSVYVADSPRQLGLAIPSWVGVGSAAYSASAY